MSDQSAAADSAIAATGSAPIAGGARIVKPTLPDERVLRVRPSRRYVHATVPYRNAVDDRSDQ